MIRKAAIAAGVLGLGLLILGPPKTAFASGTPTKTIAEVAADAGIFGKLLEAAKGAGLDDELAAAGPWTIFAPSDMAFDALPSDTVEQLMKPENRERLAAIISYHMVPSALTAADL